MKTVYPINFRDHWAEKIMIPVRWTVNLNFQTCTNFANFANLDKHKAYSNKYFIKITMKQIQIFDIRPIYF